MKIKHERVGNNNRTAGALEKILERSGAEKYLDFWAISYEYPGVNASYISQRFGQ